MADYPTSGKTRCVCVCVVIYYYNFLLNKVIQPVPRVSLFAAAK